MKVVIDGFIIARQHNWEDTPTFLWSQHNPSRLSSRETVAVMPHKIAFDVPDDFDFSAFQTKVLINLKTDILIQIKTATKEIEKIDFQLQKLSGKIEGGKT